MSNLNDHYTLKRAQKRACSWLIHGFHKKDRLEEFIAPQFTGNYHKNECRGWMSPRHTPKSHIQWQSSTRNYSKAVRATVVKGLTVFSPPIIGFFSLLVKLVFKKKLAQRVFYFKRSILLTNSPFFSFLPVFKLNIWKGKTQSSILAVPSDSTILCH